MWPPGPVCGWGNFSSLPPFILNKKAIAFYPQGNALPCPEGYTIAFQNATGGGCTCPDYDGDTYVCPTGDACPHDPKKHLSPGLCGCGVSEVDTDGDGVPDCVDGCPKDPKKTSPGVCGCGKPDYPSGSFFLSCPGQSAGSTLRPFNLLVSLFSLFA